MYFFIDSVIYLTILSKAAIYLQIGPRFGNTLQRKTGVGPSHKDQWEPRNILILMFSNYSLDVFWVVFEDTAKFVWIDQAPMSNYWALKYK